MNLEGPFLTDPKQLKAWLASVGVKNWKTNADGLVDVDGSVYLGGQLGTLTKLPVRFGKIGGGFDCGYNQLVSLEGAPKVVGGDFYCAYNRLVSLNGVPNQVGGDLYCYHNLLVDFKGLEDVSIGKNLVVTDSDVAGPDNVFESLNGLPKDLYNKVVGLDMQIVLELVRKRAANLLGAEVEELSSEVELG